MPDSPAPSPEQLIAFIKDILTRRDKREDDLPDELRAVEGMDELHALLWALRNMVYALSRGELEYPFREKGCVPGALKAMQADLRHMTWQAQRIAAGEYHHRIDFLGEFSVAFNKMAEDLEKSFKELNSLNEQYKELSSRDPLTGIHNRRAFESLVGFHLDSLKGQDIPCAIIMADIDHFKRVNDTYGHASGDDVLRAFSSTLAASLRAGDILCRFGGEEFVIFMPEADLEAGIMVAERLREAAQQTVVPSQGFDIAITASFGVAQMPPIPDDGTSLVPLLEKTIATADACLYAAKHGGRNRVCSVPEEQAS